MTPVAQAIDWTSFWQPVITALPALIVAFLGFVAVIFGSAGVAIRAMVKSTAGKEAAYLEMVKSNNDELKHLRGDLRDSDRREIALRDEIRQVRDDVDRKLGDAVAESDKKMAGMKQDYESRITELETTIANLQAQLAAKEEELKQERSARKAAETARDLATMRRDKDRNEFKQRIAALEKQAAEQKTDTAELLAAQEKSGE